MTHTEVLEYLRELVPARHTTHGESRIYILKVRDTERASLFRVLVVSPDSEILDITRACDRALTGRESGRETIRVAGLGFNRAASLAANISRTLYDARTLYGEHSAIRCTYLG